MWLWAKFVSLFLTSPAQVRSRRWRRRRQSIYAAHAFACTRNAVGETRIAWTDLRCASRQEGGVLQRQKSRAPMSCARAVKSARAPRPSASAALRNQVTRCQSWKQWRHRRAARVDIAARHWLRPRGPNARARSLEPVQRAPERAAARLRPRASSRGFSSRLRDNNTSTTGGYKASSRACCQPPPLWRA